MTKIQAIAVLRRDADGRHLQRISTMRIEPSLIEDARRVAELHGLEIECLDVMPERDEIVFAPRKGVVVSISESTVAAADFYARTTGRELVAIDDLDVLSQVANPAILVIPTHMLTADLMLWVHDTSVRSGSAPGLIIGRDAASIMRNAIKSAISLLASRTRPLAVAYVNPYAPYVIQHRNGLIEVGAGAEASDVRALVAAGHPILAIETHADIGANAWLNPSLLLCPNPLGRVSAGELRPMCLDTGQCYRFRDYPTREEAWADGRLIAPTAIAAQSLIMFGCALLRPVDGVLDPILSVGAAVADEANFGIALVAWCDEVAAEEGGTVAGLISDLSQGVAAGEALALFHRSALAKSLGAYLCLLGDPEFQLPRSFECDVILPSLRICSDGEVPRAPALPLHRLIDEILLAPTYVSATSEIQDRLRQILNTASRPPTARDSRMTWQVIADLLSSYPWLNKYNADYWSGRMASALEDCPQCLMPARTYDLFYEADRDLIRQSLLCERCGAAWNRGADSRVKATYLGGQHLRVEGLYGDVIVNVVVEARDNRFTSSQRWEFSSLRGVADINLSMDLPQGPGFCHLHVISHDTVDHFSFRCRGGSELYISSTTGPMATSWSVRLDGGLPAASLPYQPLPQIPTTDLTGADA